MILSHITAIGQTVSKTMLRLPDTGQTGSFTNTFGEDADYAIYTPYLIKSANGTVVDTVTGLMWQQTDGGEMTFENALIYADTLTLAGFSDWRLPNAKEAFSILNHQRTNPALDITVFTNSGAEYWWSSTKQVNDTAKIWCINAGGGIGNHPKTETRSAGGIKRFHARVVRALQPLVSLPQAFTDNGDGTVIDNRTQLIWQKIPYTDSLTWEQALSYAENLMLAGFSDWRLPNIKELQSINDESLTTPSVSGSFFPNVGVKKYWASTSLPNQPTKAWYLNTQYGITTYELKTTRLAVWCVRGNTNISTPTTHINDAPALTLINNKITDQTLRLRTNRDIDKVLISLSNLKGQCIWSTTLNRIDSEQSIDVFLPFQEQGWFILNIYNNRIIYSHKIYLTR